MWAVAYVARHFAGLSDLQVTLFHVLPAEPTELWDDGHILSAAEKSARQAVIERWLANREASVVPLFGRATEALVKRGFNPRQIEAKSVPMDVDVAEGVLAEAERGGYDMLILGRHGRAHAARFLLGSVATKVVNHAAGLAVCVVE